MESVRHAVAVCSWNFRTIATRAQSALIVVLAFLGVILVFVAVLGVRDGIVGQMSAEGADGVAIVYPTITGALTAAMLPVVEQAPGVQQSARGPLVSATLYAVMQLPKWTPGLFAQAGLR